MALLQQPYVGRFAPSPTGPLHFGSLLTAVASYCDAKANGGQWLLRIEDTDIPRIEAGSETAILRALDAFGLYADAAIVRQRERLQLYEDVLAQLAASEQIYTCACSRKTLAGLTAYDNRCRHLDLPVQNHALRFMVPQGDVQFLDALQGWQHSNVLHALGDFVLKRRDGIISYQLAVVVDDALQGITHVVRGADLLDNTARQILLGQALHYPALQYAHIPLAMNADGQKLSKQNLALALDIHQAPQLLAQALNALGQAPVSLDDPETMLQQAVAQWQLQHVPARLQLPAVFR